MMDKRFKFTLTISGRIDEDNVAQVSALYRSIRTCACGAPSIAKGYDVTLVKEVGAGAPDITAEAPSTEEE